jgi:hypothetical protein
MARRDDAPSVLFAGTYYDDTCYASRALHRLGWADVRPSLDMSRERAGG